MVFLPDKSLNFTHSKLCRSEDITVIIKTAPSYSDRREEMRKKLREINFKGDVYFIVGQGSGDLEANIQDWALREKIRVCLSRFETPKTIFIAVFELSGVKDPHKQSLLMKIYDLAITNIQVAIIFPGIKN